MASHLHTQIRNAVKTALTGLTTSGARVYANRLYPMEASALPGLRISTDLDEVTAQTIAQPYTQEHTLDLIVECCALASTALDDTCDAMQKEVEIALSGGFTISGHTLYPVLIGSRYDDEAAGTPGAVKRVQFSVQYFTLSNAPDTLI